MKRLFLIASLAIAGSPAVAQDALDPALGGDAFRVTLEVTRGGKWLGAPFLVMTEGQRESITVKDGSQSITLEPLIEAGTGSASVDTIVTIANQTWRPVVGVTFGSQKSVAVEQMSIKIRVEPVPSAES